MSAQPETLEAALGYRFRQRDLLMRALTHKSRAYERSPHPPEGVSDNEQLEFLGDSILGVLISENRVERFPSSPEGRLSKLKAHLVSSAHLAVVAQTLELGDYLLLGRGEELSGGREKKALLANAVEALIAAMYLDGGVEPARRFVAGQVLGDFHPAEGAGDAVTDYKSALQETAQSLGLPPPRYTVVAERGPEHSKTFVVEVRVGREWAGQAEGCSKKSAGQKAAQRILDQLARCEE
jgi:ribonuclease-3